MAGIEANSEGGYLGINTFTIPGTTTTLDLTAPFAGGVAIKALLPYTAILGALGADSRIDISGTTKTDITYSQSCDVAIDDLTVNFGFGGNPGPIGGNPGPIGDNPPPVQVSCQVIPEHATGLMAAFGFAGLLGLRRRR